ncbi:MAG: hypothetical protein ACRDJ1_01005, partial [Actinomycetota bacterium]
MSTLHPDLFSAGLPMIPGYIKHKQFGSENDIVLNFGYVPLGPEGDRLFNVGFKVADLFENLRNIPVRVTTGDQDPLSPPGRYELTVTDRLAELGYDYVHYGCSVHTHGPTNATLGQELLNWLINQVRVENPRFVVYKGNTGIDAWNEPWGNKHDAAYWLRDIRFAEASRPFLVNAESKALADTSRTATPISGAMVEPGAPPSVCHYKGLEIERGAALPLSNVVEFMLDNVSSMTFYADRAGVSVTEPLTLVVGSDHAVSLLLKGLGGPLLVEVDGQPAAISAQGSDAMLTTLAGQHTYVIRKA